MNERFYLGDRCIVHDRSRIFPDLQFKAGPDAQWVCEALNCKHYNNDWERFVEEHLNLAP